MSNLNSAIKYIESKIARRAGVFSNEDTTVLTLADANRVLSLLKTHEAEEDTLQFDMELENKYA